MINFVILSCQTVVTVFVLLTRWWVQCSCIESVSRTNDCWQAVVCCYILQHWLTIWINASSYWTHADHVNKFGQWSQYFFNTKIIFPFSNVLFKTDFKCLTHCGFSPIRENEIKKRKKITMKELNSWNIHCSFICEYMKTVLEIVITGNFLKWYICCCIYFIMK